MKKKSLWVYLIMGAFLVFTSPSYATIISYDLGLEYSGGTRPVGTPPPWLTATFDDGGSPGSVSLKMDATDLTGTEKVGAWLFNANGSDSLISSLNFNYNAGLSNTSDPTNSITTGPPPPPLNAGPAHGFDIEFVFFTNGNNFGAGDVLVYDIFSAAPIDANTFLAFNSSGKGPFETAAHVQSIGSSGGSGWIAPGSGINPVPEPTTMFLVGIGLIGLIGFGRKRFKA